MGLSGRKIILGVTGSIAAYKSVYLLRRLVEAGSDVTVVMTPEALKFVAPLTFQVLSGNKVHTDMFEHSHGGEISHLYIGRMADMVVIAPATANIIGKMACGVADDLLSTILLACKCPVLIAPAMDYEMYENRIVQKNIAGLRQLDVSFIGPESGQLASGAEGYGRMSEPEDILARIEDTFAEKKTGRDFDGRTVLVTAGPTREAIDPVRYLSNNSTGRMGYSVAEAAERRGAKVILISGPVALEQPAGVEVINVTSSEEMYTAVMDRLPDADVVVMSAAVSDFRPAEVSNNKIKKDNLTSLNKVPDGMKLNLTLTQDILKEISRKKGKQFIIGFAAETENVIENARKKLISKDLDMIVANDITKAGAGFEVETNIVTLIDRQGKVTEYPVMSKKLVADKILDHVIQGS